MSDTDKLLELFKEAESSLSNDKDNHHSILSQLKEAQDVLKENGDDPMFKEMLDKVFNAEMFKPIVGEGKSEMGCNILSSVFNKDVAVPEDLKVYLDDLHYILESTKNIQDVEGKNLLILIENIEKQTGYKALIPSFRFSWLGYVEAVIIWEHPEKKNGISWTLTVNPEYTEKKLKISYGNVSKDSLNEIHKQMEIYK